MKRFLPLPVAVSAGVRFACAVALPPAGHAKGTTGRAYGAEGLPESP